eukprot:1161553-Amphidinium_carterae.1
MVVKIQAWTTPRQRVGVSCGYYLLKPYLVADFPGLSNEAKARFQYSYGRKNTITPSLEAGQ